MTNEQIENLVETARKSMSFEVINLAVRVLADMVITQNNKSETDRAKSDE